MVPETLQFAAKRFTKQLLIRAGLEAAALSGGGRFLASAAGRGVIFTLHHVRPSRGFDFEPNGHLSVTPEFLDQAITIARQCGLQPVHLESLPDLLADSSDTRRYLCITLDDGYRDNEQFAAPVFRRHKAPYTVFITPGFVERTRTIWWETAEQLTRRASSFRFDFGGGSETVRSSSRLEKFVAFERLTHFVQSTDEDDAVAKIDAAARVAGVDPGQIVETEVMTAPELRRLAQDPLARLGAHTITHPNLARVTDERLKHELVRSAERVGDYCGRVPKAFAYPYGSASAVGVRETMAASANGFSVAVTTQPGVLTSRALERRTALARVSLNGDYQKSRYVKALISGLPFGFM